ncbi:hypothetical protein FPZ43_03965 [Mucilaginibacter pallidiroseus]|uniref:Transglutaminase-like domain-containing protein n=2 Tax=Mucilaginibacter pallidiroseus TaxID=2599295 RepID=A0A563UK57_9SPHI|nr:hypothetical protein FPZ43_03965 [Mucilaginibacter pallidiroseus]
MLLAQLTCFGQGKTIRVDFYKTPFTVSVDQSVLTDLVQQPKSSELASALHVVSKSNFRPLIDSLSAYRERLNLNDWLYYQLVRRVAEQIAPKDDNYARYTFYKWFIMAQSGFDVRLALANIKIILYIYNDEEINDIPYFMVDDKKFTCLNYHDYAKADLNSNPPKPVLLKIAGAVKPFSYRVTMMPDFKPEDDFEKTLSFMYGHKKYHFSIKLNSQRQAAFANYPGVSFDSYFNIPMSNEAYASLIPLLKKNVAGMNEQKGVDYLMRFTRYAFLYENDEENFGREKRLSPEETLLSNYSDCDDRAALFYYLVKEIYNLPMIALLYPTHITMAVSFDKPVGQPILYKGKYYSLCEPTPQNEDLKIGQLSSRLKNKPFDIVYHYEPSARH